METKLKAKSIFRQTLLRSLSTCVCVFVGVGAMVVVEREKGLVETKLLIVLK